MENKWMRWLPSLTSIVLIIVFVEGGLMWAGIAGVVLVHILLVGLRMYRQRESLKMVFSIAGDLGKMHKDMANMEVLEPKEIKVVKNAGSYQTQTERKSAGNN
jgi:hypothetical protein